MGKPSSSSSAIRLFGSDKDECKRPTLEEETIVGLIELTPRWMQEALKTAFSGILKQEDKKRQAFKSMIIASNKGRRIVLKKRVLSNVTEKRNRHVIADMLGFYPLPTTSNTMAPSALKMEPSTSKTMKMESYTSNTMAPSTLKMEPSTSKTMEMESYTSTAMVPSTFKMEPSTSKTLEMESYTSNTMPPSTLKMEPSTSKTMEMESYTSTTVKPSTSSVKPSTSPVIPSTQIPEAFEWIRAVSTVKEREKVLGWARTKAFEIELEDPNESMRLLMWAEFLFTAIVQYPEPQKFASFLWWGLSTSTKEAPDERKRLLKWAHSTARVTAPDECKRWSLQEEILKPFETALDDIQIEMIKYGKKYARKYAKKHGFPKHKDSYPYVNQEHIIYTFKGKHGCYECRNALWIWTKYLYFYGIPLRQLHRGPVYFGEKIKDNFPDTDMIEGKPLVNELGFVTIELSGKWIAKSIHKMLIDGLYTWAPKLPMKKVILFKPPLDDRTRFDAARRMAITGTQIRILEFSNVVVLDNPTISLFFERNCKWLQPNNKWFPFEEREADVLIKGQIPLILPKRDFEKVYDDIRRFWAYDMEADWILSIAPVWQHVYHEIYLAVTAELEKGIPFDGPKTTKTSFAAYETGKLPDLPATAQYPLGVATELGYSEIAVLECAHKYTSLKNHRLDVCTLNIIDEMLNEEGNTLVYLLNTRAELHRITNDYREDIDEVKKASELKLEKDKGWEKGEERILGLHLLEFTEALEESCLSVLPHILCEYVYDLSKKFNEYHLSVCKDGFVAETSTLLLYEATAVVMEQCFNLLGIDPQCIPPIPYFTTSVEQLEKGLVIRVDDLATNLRDPHRNSRFQPFSFCIRPMTLGCGNDSKLFGLISVYHQMEYSLGGDNKHGLPSDGGSHFFEPDFAYVPLFNHDWLNPVDMTDGELVYFQSPAVRLSSFSSFISVQMELYVNKKNKCHQVCNQNKVIDLSDFWGKKLDGECGCLSVNVEQGSTSMYYILLKDAVDIALEVKFVTDTNFLREVGGYVVAYYGDEFLYDSKSGPAKDCYFALLFLPKPPYSLQASTFPLIKSRLAVPTMGSLIVKAYFEDFYSGEVILNNSCKFKPQLEKSCKDDSINGLEGSSLKVKVVWDPEDSYL